MESDSTDTPPLGDLMARAVDLAVQRSGFSLQQAQDRLIANAEDLGLQPDELAFLVVAQLRGTDL